MNDKKKDETKLVKSPSHTITITSPNPCLLGPDDLLVGTETASMHLLRGRQVQSEGHQETPKQQETPNSVCEV